MAKTYDQLKHLKSIFFCQANRSERRQLTIRHNAPLKDLTVIYTEICIGEDSGVCLTKTSLAKVITQLQQFHDRMPGPAPVSAHTPRFVIPNTTWPKRRHLAPVN